MRPTHGLLLPTVVLSLLGCASTPLEEAREGETAGPALPLQRAVALVVEIEPGLESLYGTDDEWRADFLRVAAELDACARLVPEGEKDEADMTVTVGLSRAGPTEPDIQTTGAFLDFLAWSTIPFLPLWIPDVSIQPELEVRVQRQLRSVESVTIPLFEAQPPRTDRVSTCYLDRRPFFSWPTLGALLVPPFVFSGTDRERIEERIGAWVREATAVQVATIVRESRPNDMGDELLSGLAVRAGPASKPVLTFTAAPALRRVVASVAGKEVGKAESAGSPPSRLELDLSAVSAVDGAPSHVRVLAVGNRTGLSLRYTVRVPPEAASASPPEGGMP
jgi:hypothetical protein